MTENSKKQIDACRFCWMCRHICPIGNATGLERNTARARALGLSLVNRGVYGLEQVADNLYECACCGGCTKDCVTGWDPVAFTKEARKDAALQGKLPAYIEKAVDACLDTGNAYGKTELDPALKAAIAAHEAKTDTLLFLGVDARYLVSEAAIKTIRVLEKAGVSFTVLADEPASGQQLEYLVSAVDETKQQMIRCAEAVSGYQTVIAADPQDAKVFLREYQEWGVTQAVSCVTLTAYLVGLLKDGKLTAKQSGRAVVYQDPFQLARDLNETEPARAVIGAYAKCGEMLCHGKDTMWAGNLLMAQWMPDVMKRVAEDRIVNAKGMKADTIVTASVSEYASLKAVAQPGFTVLSLEDLILA